MRDPALIDELARHLHEAGRAAVLAGQVVNKVPGPFLEWHQITDEAREGRRVQARYLFGQGLIDVEVVQGLADIRRNRGGGW
jgi:hypothetical protein